VPNAAQLRVAALFGKEARMLNSFSFSTIGAGSALGRAALIAIGSAIAGCAGHPVVVTTGLPDMAATAGVAVNGIGEVKAPPDIARTNLGVEVRADTVDQASAAANQSMSALITAMKQLGIADNDLRTHSFSIAFEPAPIPPGPVPMPAQPSTPVQPPTPVRGVYRVNNMVEVTIRDLDKAGRVLQVATDAGANSVWGVSFELEDPKPLMEQARIKAMEDAKHNALALAKLAGVTLGPITSVSESGANGGPVQPMFAMKAARDGGDVPIERGEITISDQVQLVYALPDR
jgi:uncharacterized protein YggE